MEILEEIFHRISTPWLIGAAAVLWAFGQSGFVQRLFKGRADERIAAADRLSDDQRDLISRLEKALEQEHAWRLSEAAFYQGEITTLRKTMEALAETGRSSERGNARLRHALNNAFQYIDSLRAQLKRAGAPVVPFNGWHTFLGLSDDLDKHLREQYGPFDEILGGDGKDER